MSNFITIPNFQSYLFFINILNLKCWFLRNKTCLFWPKKKESGLKRLTAWTCEILRLRELFSRFELKRQRIKERNILFLRQRERNEEHLRATVILGSFGWKGISLSPAELPSRTTNSKLLFALDFFLKLVQSCFKGHRRV